MKIKTGFLITVFLIMLFGLSSIKAANVTELKSNTTYELDLNGKGQSVRIEMADPIYDRHSEASWHMYVNGEQVASYNFGSHSGDEDIDIYYLDVNNKDKYKEIFVMSREVNMCLVDARIIRYRSEKNVDVMSLNKGVVKDAKRMSIISCDGNNNIMFWADTPFTNLGFGCYYCKVTGKVTSKGITIKKQKTYKLELPNRGLSSRGNLYELKRSMKLYKSSSGRGVKMTLKPGTKFIAKQIKPSSFKRTSWGYNIWKVYVEVKMTSGKKGWLSFSNSEYGYYLVYTPGWG